ncbi:phosphoesterase PA-phosphatase [Streptomyces sp. NBC_01803]|uniref:phosphoesterase PA-phosphatase n=1 Tax=Streptomyces sp. NBC_01803 TaxID=2975946 RepID=UPI002DD954F7|nr:phosphoesterase PA-phosphatase [Streptomyces sp. NBC_01803]WSA43455.1 phosphatase PAP2 family protein [Streptomyces sp. NBC_01803]
MVRFALRPFALRFFARHSSVLASAVALAAVATVVAPSAAGADDTARPGSRVDVALEWYDVTAQTVATAGAPTQVTNSRTWAISWLAAARVLDDGPPDGVSRPDYQDAAVAGAVHTALTTLAPARAGELDAALRRTLDRVPDGPAEDLGLAAGRAEAESVLADREGDGLDAASVNAPYATPAPAPGVWQPTPPAYGPALQAGNRSARPFLLDSPDQYRLPAPPPVGSARYEADLAEVRAYGAADSTVRTARQTETASFWYGSSLTLYTEPLRVALARSGESLPERAALVALFHTASVDTQIATSDSKYAYVTWRPVTALQAEGDTDWTPLHVTPSHPDYPSGHNTYSGAAEGILTALAGPRTAPFELTSTTAPGVTRTYTTWRQLTQENVDARVWSGIHTRTADTAGVRLGLQVAAHTLRHADELLG